MGARSVRVVRLPMVEKKLSFFRWGDVAGKKLVTNDAGAWHFLSERSFEEFLAGRIEEGHPEYKALAQKGFLRDGLDLDGFAQKIGRKKRFVGQGPHLHIVITTLRCNQSCKYCHASRTNMDRVDTDMSLETAKKIVDHAMQSTSPYINFEFQGGEPTVNMPVIKFITEYSREKNKYENKQLDLSLVTNMTYMTEENAEWLIDSGVMVCTSLDGPEELHNYNRSWRQGIERLRERAQVDRLLQPPLRGEGPRPPALARGRAHDDVAQDVRPLEGSRRSLHRARDAHDLPPPAQPLRLRGRYLEEDWLHAPTSTSNFYKQALGYIIEKNLAGIEICEGTAATFLSKMLTPDDPNFVDIRSPCGAGTGQVAYNYDGKIFTCDEARMTSAMGNDMFQIGQVGVSSYEDAYTHPTVKAMAVASLQDALPHCESCWNKPFCGVCPMHNYMTSGDLFGQRPNSPKCKEHYTIAEVLFERLADDPDGQLDKIFRRWTLTRPREQCAV